MSKMTNCHIEMTRESAKKTVLALFQKKVQLSYSDIMSLADLDLELIVEICAELETDGKIEGVGNVEDD